MPATHEMLDTEAEDTTMFRLAIGFLIVAMIAALFGFGLFADFTFDAAKLLFFVFLVMAVITFLADAFRTGRTDPA